HKAESRHIGDKAVNIIVIYRTDNSFSTILLCDNTDIGRMCLSGKDHVRSPDTDCSAEPFKILPDRCIFIAPCETQVHALIDSGTHSAHAGGESMMYQTALLKKRKRQIRNVSCSGAAHNIILIVCCFPCFHNLLPVIPEIQMHVQSA